MTPHGARAGEDAEDLDVEEVLALVKNSNGHHLPDPAARGETDSARTSHQPDPSARPDARHRATPWPEARALAERAGRNATRAARRAPVSAPLDTALGLTLAAPLDALTD